MRSEIKKAAEAFPVILFPGPNGASSSGHENISPRDIDGDSAFYLAAKQQPHRDQNKSDPRDARRYLSAAASHLRSQLGEAFH